MECGCASNEYLHVRGDFENPHLLRHRCDSDAMLLIMRAAIIGCGLIGRKRSQALAGCRLTVCCDALADRAEALAKPAGAVALTDWQAAVTRADVDIVLVATTHNMLGPIGCAAAATGKHVLIDKPGARRAAELDPVRAAASRTGARVR